MMRYQRVSPDCLPLSNGKKPNSRPSPSRTAHKEDNNRSSSNGENRRGTPVAGGGGFSSACTSTNSSLDGGISKGFRFRSPSRAHHDTDASHSQSPNPNPNRVGAAGGGDVLLQWGQRKRSRVSRAEIRSVTDDSSSSSGQAKLSSANKIQRRALNPSMPPPPPPPPLLCGVTRGSNPRNGLVTSRESIGFLSTRNLEDRSTIPNGSTSRTIAGNSRAVSRSSAAAAAGKRSPPSADKRINGKETKQNGGSLHADHHHHHRVIRSESTAQNQPEQEANGEKAHVEVIEWPRIYLALSRKEKEEDFLAMKGTKLPHRPRKRAKNVDKALQYCFPGMWLSDLTKSRYEVREKKCAKKQKRRGLKGMENMDSDSE